MTGLEELTSQCVADPGMSAEERIRQMDEMEAAEAGRVAPLIIP